MKSKILLFLFTIFGTVILSSCSSDDNSEKRIEYAKIVESRTCQDLLNDMYVGSDADVEAIARIMNVTPSSIERIRRGETDPTEQFEERIREVSLYYMQNDQSFSKLRSVLDPEYGWCDTLMDAPSNHPKWFWGINIVLLIMAIEMVFSETIGIIGLVCLFLEYSIYCYVWFSAWICSPEKMEDQYINSINPTIEVIK
jgi:transcriptional regulator with XRE-family HTH domain